MPATVELLSCVSEHARASAALALIGIGAVSDQDLAWPKLLIYLSVQYLVPGGFQQL